MIKVDAKRLGSSNYRISIDKKIQQDAARNKRINLKDLLFEHLTHSAKEFTKNRALQKELVSVFKYYTISHWGHDLIRTWVKMEHDFNYIVVLLKHKGIKLEKAVKIAILIFRAELLMRMHKFTIAHKFDAHLKKEIRRHGAGLIIRYLPHLEIHKSFEEKIFK